MGVFIANQVVNLLKNQTKDLNKSNVLVMGITFKENCPDYRNTKVVDIISNLRNSGLKVDVFDPWVKGDSFENTNNIIVYNKMPNIKYDAIILAVGHDLFHTIDLTKYKKSNDSIIYDVKGFLDKETTKHRL